MTTQQLTPRGSDRTCNFIDPSGAIVAAQADVNGGLSLGSPVGPGIYNNDGTAWYTNTLTGNAGLTTPSITANDYELISIVTTVNAVDYALNHTGSYTGSISINASTAGSPFFNVTGSSFSVGPGATTITVPFGQQAFYDQYQLQIAGSGSNCALSATFSLKG